MLRLFSIWFFAFAAAHVDAAEVSVAFQHDSSMKLDSTAVAVVATALTGGATISRSVDLASVSSIDLSAGQWRLEVRSDAWWHQPVYLSVEQAPVATAIKLFPAGYVTGRVELKNAAPAVRDLLLHFEHAGNDAAFPRDEVRCDIEAAEFRCRIPRGTLDLRLRAPGFLPHYFWDAHVESHAPLNLGDREFVKGASLTGAVVIGRGVGADRGKVEIVAVPLNVEARPRQAKTRAF